MDRVFEINYLPLAENDLRSIIEYIMIDDPLTAMNILDRFDETIEKLTTFPYMGTVPRNANIAQLNYRFLVVETFLVFYVVRI